MQHMAEILRPAAHLRAGALVRGAALGRGEAEGAGKSLTWRGYESKAEAQAAKRARILAMGRAVNRGRRYLEREARRLGYKDAEEAMREG